MRYEDNRVFDVVGFKNECLLTAVEVIGSQTTLTLLEHDNRELRVSLAFIIREVSAETMFERRRRRAARLEPQEIFKEEERICEFGCWCGEYFRMIEKMKWEREHQLR